MTIGENIAAIAKKYIGETEIPGNKGFTDPDFQKKMIDVGWKMSYAWCILFCELVWKEAYGKDNENFPVMDKLFSASALATFYNFKGHPTWPTSKVPSVGAIAIFKHGVDPKKFEGHAGIVVLAEKNSFQDVEGNTNDRGGRDGYIVSEKKRLLNVPPTAKGLNLIGFINPV